MSETLRAYDANHCDSCFIFIPCGYSWVTPAEVIGRPQGHVTAMTTEQALAEVHGHFCSADGTAHDDACVALRARSQR